MMQWYWRLDRGRKRQLTVLGLCWLVAVPVAAAADGEVEVPPAPDVSLDQLLTLPAALPVESGERAGVTRAEWNSRFAQAQVELDTAKSSLDESLNRLAEMAAQSGNWKVAAPGGQAAPDDNSPINYGLKQEIRRKREELERAERKLRDLAVEANLAGVPEHWYTASTVSD